MNKKKDTPRDLSDIQEIPTVTEDSSALGEIKINHKVVANIVQLAAMDVDGVVAVVGSNIVDRLEGIFSKKEAGSAIHVEENEMGHYVIVIHTILSFGVELAKTAFKIQTSVRDNVQKMTNKQVEKVNVIIEGIQPETVTSEKEDEDWSSQQHTD